MSLQEYDLTPKIGEYLDLHLLFPLLNFMQDNELYPTEEMLQAKIDLLSKTNMVDYAGDVYMELHKKDLPEEMEAKKSELINKLEEVETNCQKMIDLKKR